jgi:hypothetical protein
MNVIPENILTKMEPADRAKLPKELRLTANERQTVAVNKLEREMHNGFSNWLNLRKRFFSFVHTNPVRKSTIRKGWPDFTVLHRGRALLIEFKVPPNSLTAEQKDVFQELSVAGNQIYVCTTLEDAIHLTIEHFNLPPEWKEIQ